MSQSLFDYNDICFENMTLQMEIEGLSDDALLDECNRILAGFYHSDEMDDILISYFKTGEISKQQRTKAEALYILANGDFAWEI